MDKSRLLEAIRAGSIEPFITALYYKDSPSAPAPPDYTGAAYAQGAANIDTARAQGRMNNPNIYTPYGSQTVSWGGGGSGGQPSGPGGSWSQPTPIYGNVEDEGGNRQIMGYNAPVWTPDGSGSGSTGVGGSYGGDQPTITQTLSPAQQQLLDAQNRISGNLAGVAESGLNRVSSGMNQPFDMSGIPAQQYGVQGGNYTTGVNGGPMQMGIGSGGDLQRNLDFSGAPTLPGVNDFGKERDLVTNALLSRSEPQFQRDEELTRTRLINQGLAPGSEASNYDLDTLNRARNDARMQATLAGSQEQSRLFGLASQARGQYTGEQAQQGQFANNAQNQAFTQGLAGGQFANAAQAQQFGQGQANAALNNQVQQQMFQQGLANANLGNQGRQSAIQEQAYLRSLPLNELNALRTGAQVQNPQFQPYQGVNVGQTPIFGAAQAQGAANQQQYANQVGQSNAFNQGLFALGAAAMGAPTGTFNFLRG